jgi:hypothetical protein
VILLLKTKTLPIQIQPKSYRMKKCLFSLVLLLFSTASFCQDAEKFVNDLLSKMTLEEKIRAAQSIYR